MKGGQLKEQTRMPGGDQIMIDLSRRLAVLSRRSDMANNADLGSRCERLSHLHLAGLSPRMFVTEPFSRDAVTRRAAHAIFREAI